VVDEASRRAVLAEAVWRVIRRDGLQRASVRRVAAEAGLAVGSVRHYFPSQAELLRFAMRTVTRRIGQRIAAADLPLDPVARAEWILEELLPLDAERQAEVEVWQAFAARALVDPASGRIRDAGHRLLLALCREIVRGLRAVAPHLDVDHEAARLAGLVTGLAVGGPIAPGPVAAVRIRELLAWHIDSMLSPRALPG
jgi:AcrR family transcriptional regulator